MALSSEELKLAFTLQVGARVWVVAVPVCGDRGKALEKDDPCISRAVVPEEVQSVVEWMA